MGSFFDSYLQTPSVSDNKSSQQRREYVIGDLIYDQYKIIDMKKNGNIGMVYICEDVITRSMFALKCTNKNFTNEEEINSFYRELKNWVSIPFHPNVVPVLSAFRINLVPYMIMPYIESDDDYNLTLQDWIDNKYPFDIDVVVYIASQICRGMLHCINSYKEQRLGDYIHGDLKPDNIFIEKTTADKYTVKIADCGGIAHSNLPDGYKKPTPQTDIYQCIHIMIRVCNANSENDALKEMGANLNAMFFETNNWPFYDFSELYELFDELFQKLNGYSIEKASLPHSESLAQLQHILTLSSYEIRVTREYDKAYSRLEKCYEEVCGKNIIVNENMLIEALILQGMASASSNDFNWVRFEKNIIDLKKVVEEMPDSAKNKLEKFYSFDVVTDLQTESGVAYFEQGKYVEAAEILGSLDFSKFFNFDWLEKLADAYLHTAQIEKLRTFSQKLQVLIKKLEEDKKDKYMICGLKALLAKVSPAFGEFDITVSLWEECLEVDPDNLEYLHRYSEFLVWLGRITESRYPLHRLYRLCEINLQSDIADRMTLYYYMTTSLYMLAEFDMSYSCYEKYLQYHDNSDRKIADAKFLELIRNNGEEFANWKIWREENLTNFETYKQFEMAYEMYTDLTAKYTPQFGEAYYKRAKYQIIVDLFQLIIRFLTFVVDPVTQKPIIEITDVIKMCEEFLTSYDPKSYTVTLCKARAYAVNGDYALSKQAFSEAFNLVDLAFPTGLLKPDGNPEISPIGEREKLAIREEMKRFL